MPPTGCDGGAFAIGDLGGNDLMAVAGRFLVVGWDLDLVWLALAASILNMERLLKSAKLRYDRD